MKTKVNQLAVNPDLVLVNPGNSAKTYQELSSSLRGIEPPFWAGLLASYVRGHGYEVKILDADAENWSPEYTADRVAELHPALMAMVVQGSNPSASSTPKMTAAGDVLKALKAREPGIKAALAGIHPSALPKRTLREEATDFVIQGEPFYAILELLGQLKISKVMLQPFTRTARLLEPSQFPPVAWDLLDMSKYRAHNWHCLDDIDKRSPYAVIYTSMGCPYHCHFCSIHTFFGPGIRYRNPEHVVAEIDLLVEKYGVRNIKITDEMFAISEKRVSEICTPIIERGYDLNMWAYARADTVTKPMLEKMRKAGIRWIGYGLESASNKVRSAIGKRFSDEAIERAIEMAWDAGIHHMPAFIFGLPDDNMESMQSTLDMAKDYNFEYVNFYCATAYPGSKLWNDALHAGVKLPERWEDYSQLAYGFISLPTKYLSADEVVKFRDNAFREYFSRPEYLRMIEGKFGPKARDHIEGMLRYKIQRNQHEAKDLP